MVPMDDVYEASIDTEESERRHHVKEEGKEVEQPMGVEASVASPSGGEGQAGPSGEASVA